MRLLTVHSWIIACLCCLIFQGCASKQIAHFSIAPEFDQHKINAISKSAAVRHQNSNNKTNESVKSDQIRVTGFNKRTIQSRNKQVETQPAPLETEKPNESALQFDEFEDFHSIALTETDSYQADEVDPPVEAQKPDLSDVPPVFVMELPPTTEVVLSKNNVTFQTEQEKAPSVKSPHLVELGLKPITQLSISAKPPAGELPKNTAAEQLEKLPTRQVTMGETRNWELSTMEWEAPGVAYNPLYFEEPYLERYGYNYGALQPFLSAGRFFGRIPVLPYMIGAYPMDECRYPLGYARPGDCPPYQVEKLPYSTRGVLFESLTVTGLVFLIP
ncbi:hypothetical protein Pan241w_30870 [Gimesia alba]|uniref:Uncharacterized protein n=1 Tax=Gimesia alba TaxID=2527973 RepID=A0A517RGJ2_9PLAN|nr:hypothetical protein [Gimesia alba]QDT42992.1 hypothetical protein Pan241w_30870 [Gimesia alba]